MKKLIAAALIVCTTIAAGGKLFKIGEAPSPRLVRGRRTAVMLEFGAKCRGPTS